MKDFFWNVFEKSGSIEAFLAYKEFSNTFENPYRNDKSTESRDFND